MLKSDRNRSPIIKIKVVSADRPNDSMVSSSVRRRDKDHGLPVFRFEGDVAESATPPRRSTRSLHLGIESPIHALAQRAPQCHQVGMCRRIQNGPL